MSSSYFSVMHAIISLQICMLATHAKTKKDISLLGVCVVYVCVRICVFVWVNYMLAVCREVNKYYCSSLTCTQFRVLL